MGKKKIINLLQDRQIVIIIIHQMQILLFLLFLKNNCVKQR